MFSFIVGATPFLFSTIVPTSTWFVSVNIRKQGDEKDQERQD